MVFALSLSFHWVRSNCHTLDPAGLQVPPKTRLSVVLRTVTFALVKVTVHPALKSLPILTRLLVNEGVTWLVFVLMGRLGRLSVAVADDCNSCPDAVLMVLDGVLMPILMTGATGMK